MRTISRRGLLGLGAAAGAALALPVREPAVASPGGALAKYVQPLPVPGGGIAVAQHNGNHEYAFKLREISRRVHPSLPPTPLWAYDDGSGLDGQAGSFGLVVLAQAGVPVRANFTSELPERYPLRLPVDTRLTPLGDEVRVMAHLHGGFVAAEDDGNPAVTPLGFGYGQTQSVYYPNEPVHNPAAMMWFHDHGLGATRLNVVAGLAAGYLIRDEHDTGLEPNPIGLPGGAYEIPLVIQDRQLNADGTIRYPVSDIPGSVWVGEYFGDVMLVNGKVWPFVDAEPRLYRFRILNGCNARILNLVMGGARMWQIGAEGGLWDRPVPVTNLVLAPAERADVVVDLRPLAGKAFTMRNLPLPHPVVSPASPLVSVMQVRVANAVTTPGPATVPSSLPGRAASLPAASRTRFLPLNEVGAEGPDWRLNIGGAGFGQLAHPDQPVTGTVEDWVYVNLTEDTHPLHTHLFTHQVVGRTPFDAEAYQADHAGPDGVVSGVDPTPYATGPMQPASPQERGFKDTTKANPGFFTTIRGRVELPAGVTAPQTYVHHCHILEHEDNDMMQPFTVVPEA
jgi:spore coat protein A